MLPAINMAIYGAVQFRPWKPVLLALEYYYWKREYEGGEEGVANRVNFYSAFSSSALLIHEKPAANDTVADAKTVLANACNGSSGPSSRRQSSA